MLNKNTDGNAQYRTPGQTVAQWRNGGVLVGGKSRGSRPLVRIEAGSRINAGSRLEAGRGQGRLRTDRSRGLISEVLRYLITV